MREFRLEDVVVVKTPSDCKWCERRVNSYVESVKEWQKSYDQALKRIENLRAALLDLYETTKAEHGVHESEIEPWDSSSLGNAKGALADDQGEEK